MPRVLLTWPLLFLVGSTLALNAEVGIDVAGQHASTALRVPNVEWTFNSIHELVMQKNYKVGHRHKRGGILFVRYHINHTHTDSRSILFPVNAGDILWVVDTFLLLRA